MDKFGKYEVAGKIGVGGFGEVYRGFDPFIKRSVAIKTCLTDDENIRTRFFREAEIAGNLHHRNITTVYDFGVEDGVPYLVQEFLNGEDLDELIKRGERLPWERQLAVLHDVARGLAYAQEQGVVHRDVKPGNIRILGNGTAKIMDFGIAKLLHQESGLTKTGMTVGTAAYLAPEQVQGQKVDQRADIFSFGVLAYELMTGERPFQGETFSAVLYQILTNDPRPMSELWPDCPAPMAELVERCVAKRPEDRWPSFAPVVERLAELRGGDLPLRDAAPTPAPAELPLRAQPAAASAAATSRPGASAPTELVRTAAAGGGARRLLWLVAAAAVAAVAAGGWWLWSNRDAGPPAAATIAAAPAGGVEEGGGETATEAAAEASAAAPAPTSRPGGDLEGATGGGDGAGQAPPEDGPPGSGSPAAEAESAPPPEPEPAPPPEPGELVVARAWTGRMTVDVDGTARQTLDREVRYELSPGRHRVRFALDTAEYRASEVVTVEIASGGSRRLESPIQPPASLTVQAHIGSPQGEVRLDGESLGNSPIQSRAISPGAHRIEIVPLAEGELMAVGHDLVLDPGAEAILTFDLRGERELLVTVRDPGAL